MTSGRQTARSRRVAAPGGRRLAGRRARGLARWRGALLLAFGALAAAGAAATACEQARHGAYLAREVDRRWPGSGMEVEERNMEGARTVQVTVHVGALPDDLEELRAPAEELARVVRDRYGLRAGPDSVAVVLRTESNDGVTRAERRARFRWPVADLDVPGAEPGAR